MGDGTADVKTDQQKLSDRMTGGHQAKRTISQPGRNLSDSLLAATTHTPS